MSAPQEKWSSRLGVIMAVAGSAVGLGNFLRFPGLVSQYGGGAFLIAYFISLLIIGLPIGWAEWAMGRHGGVRGFHSGPGVMFAFTRSHFGKYLGLLAVLVPVCVYFYYVFIESWCLAYSWKAFSGQLHFENGKQAADSFTTLTGQADDGSIFKSGLSGVLPWLAAVFLLNFFLIYRGLSKGIEKICNWGMPALIILALIVLGRVLTLGAPDPAKPDNSVINGLGFMWNPVKVVLEERPAGGTEKDFVAKETLLPNTRALAAAEAAVQAAPDTFRIVEIHPLRALKNPDLWLAAAGQIFFSLSVGFGVIITYASYLKKKDDVVLSGLTATAANEFCEVALGGLITVPAAVAFLGVAGAVGGTFGLGFIVLPQVFAQMPGGQIFGGLFFFLLFLAAVTSSISMLQPGIAFLEEAMGLKRKMSVAILMPLTLMGLGVIVWFSKDLMALDIVDHWVGTFCIFVLATIQILVFAWHFGVERGLADANQGALFPIPRFFGFIMKWVCPAFLLGIFGLWIAKNVFGVNFSGGESKLDSHVTALFGKDASTAAWMGMATVLITLGFFALVLKTSKRYRLESLKD